MPSSRHAKMIAHRDFAAVRDQNFLEHRRPLGPDREQPLAVLHRLAVLDVDVDDFAVVLGVDLVHQLHRFDDAEHLPLLHRRADFDERRRARLGRPIERADDRRLDDRQLDVASSSASSRGGAAGAGADGAGAGGDGRRRGRRRRPASAAHRPSRRPHPSGPSAAARPVRFRTPTSSCSRTRSRICFSWSRSIQSISTQALELRAQS